MCISPEAVALRHRCLVRQIEATAPPVELACHLLHRDVCHRAAALGEASEHLAFRRS